MYVVKPLVQGAALTTSAQVLYTAPGTSGTTTGTYTRISQASVTNTDTVAHTIQIYLTPGAAAPTTGDNIIYNKTLAVNETFVPYQMVGAVCAPGGSIQASVDGAGAANTVIFKASGIEFS